MNRKKLVEQYSFWSKHPYCFVEDYLPIKLSIFQKVLICFMSKATYLIAKIPYFIFIATRDVDKSHLFLNTIYQNNNNIISLTDGDDLDE